MVVVVPSGNVSLRRARPPATSGSSVMGPVSVGGGLGLTEGPATGPAEMPAQLVSTLAARARTAGHLRCITHGTPPRPTRFGNATDPDAPPRIPSTHHGRRSGSHPAVLGPGLGDLRP